MVIMVGWIQKKNIITWIRCVNRAENAGIGFENVVFLPILGNV